MSTPGFRRLSLALLLFWQLASGTTRADILYVTNSGNNTIEKFTSGGVGSVFANTHLDAPAALAFDGAGNLYAANQDLANPGGNSIARFTPGGVGSVFVGSGLDQPYGLAFDRGGNLYTTNATNIERLTPSGVGSVFASTGLNNALGLAFDNAGNLYAANQGNSTIERFTPGGVASVFASTGLNQPTGIAFDRAGNLYVANSGDNTIEKFTPRGVGSTFVDTGLTGPAEVIQSLAFDSAGNLYVAVAGITPMIEKYASDGSGAVFASGADSGMNSPGFIAFTDDAGQPLGLPPGSVPEPTCLCFVGFASAVILLRRRRGDAAVAGFTVRTA